MPWPKPGWRQDATTLQVTGVEGTVMGCHDRHSSITMTTFLVLNLWFVVVFWLMIFYRLSFTLDLYFFPSCVSVFFSPLSFSSL